MKLPLDTALIWLDLTAVYDMTRSVKRKKKNKESHVLFKEQKLVHINDILYNKLYILYTHFYIISKYIYIYILNKL